MRERKKEHINEVETNQHSFKLHGVGILHTATILESPPQILLRRLGNSYKSRASASKPRYRQVVRD